VNERRVADRRADLNQALANRSALDQQLQEKRALLDAQAIDRARSDELRTQIARFQLLDKHYQSRAGKNLCYT